GAGLAITLAAAAQAQVHKVVFELALDDPRNAQEVDTCVAASTKRAIVASNPRLTILDLESTPRGDEMDFVWAQDSTTGLPSAPATTASRSGELQATSGAPHEWSTTRSRAASGSRSSTSSTSRIASTSPSRGMIPRARSTSSTDRRVTGTSTPATAQEGRMAPPSIWRPR